MGGIATILPFIPIVLIAVFFYFLILRKLPAYFKYKKTIKYIVKNGADNETAQELIHFFNKIGSILNRPSNWDTARANFELINQSDRVSPELKQELRNTLLGLGVSRLEKVRAYKNL